MWGRIMAGLIAGAELERRKVNPPATSTASSRGLGRRLFRADATSYRADDVRALPVSSSIARQPSLPRRYSGDWALHEDYAAINAMTNWYDKLANFVQEQRPQVAVLVRKDGVVQTHLRFGAEASNRRSRTFGAIVAEPRESPASEQGSRWLHALA